MKRNLPVTWHIINACIGFAIVLAITFISLLIIGLLLGDPGFAGEKLGVPVLAIACVIEVVGGAKRTAKLNAKKKSEDRPFQYGFGFHLGNSVLALIVMMILFIIPAIIIPFTGISPQHAWIPLMLSVGVIFVFVLSFASLRADKHIWKKAAESNEPIEIIVDDGKTRCPNCGTPYDLNDYRDDVSEIFCSSCKNKITSNNKVIVNPAMDIR